MVANDKNLLTLYVSFHREYMVPGTLDYWIRNSNMLSSELLSTRVQWEGTKSEIRINRGYQRHRLMRWVRLAG